MTENRTKRAWWEDPDYHAGSKVPRMSVLIGVIAAVFAAFVVAIVAASLWVASMECHAWERQTGEEVRYDLWAGCFVETDTGWVTLDQIRSNR